MTSFICEGQSMIITSTYELNNKYYLKEDDVLNFVILYEINYYYYDQNDNLGMVSYYERTQSITFNNLENTIEVVLTVSPKTEIKDFKCFKYQYSVIPAPTTRFLGCFVFLVFIFLAIYQSIILGNAPNCPLR